ncbi:MAG: YraN family protein [Clostridiales bacterium]|nr:YraN family protein [Clostridiales bacterium]
MSYKKKVGMRGEELAAEYLERLGFTISARNFHVSHDEIDIVAEDDKYIVFAEVKTRAQTGSNKRYGRPAAAVNYTKQQKLIRAAEEYLRRFAPKKQPRIDVIEVYFPAIHEDTPIDIATLIPLEIKHFRNAVHK